MSRKSRRSEFISWAPCRGRAGEWQPLHAPPSKWSFGSIWGNFAGFATFARWQVKQIVFGSGLTALRAEGSCGVLREGPVAGLAADAGVLAALQGVALVRVALDAGGAAREARRAHAVVGEGAGAVMAVEAEPLRNEDGPRDQEQDDARPRRAPPCGTDAPCPSGTVHDRGRWARSGAACQ